MGFWAYIKKQSNDINERRNLNEVQSSSSCFWRWFIMTNYHNQNYWHEYIYSFLVARVFLPKIRYSFRYPPSRLCYFGRFLIVSSLSIYNQTWGYKNKIFLYTLLHNTYRSPHLISIQLEMKFKYSNTINAKRNVELLVAIHLWSRRSFFKFFIFFFVVLHRVNYLKPRLTVSSNSQ